MPLPISSTSSAATVSFMQQALFGGAAGNAVYSTGISEVASGGASAYAISLGNNFSALDSPLATTVLTNLGITSTSIASASYTLLQTALTQAFAAFPTARGQVVLNLCKILSGLESDATYGTAATAFNTAIVSNVSYSASTSNTSSRALDPAAAPAGQTFTLTTGVDISGVLASASGSTSTAGGDTFNAILGTGATLNTFDNINGGALTDTLNLIDSTAAAFAVPSGAILAGFETVNLNRSAAAAATSIGVTVIDTTFGTGVKTLNVSETGLAQTAAAASVTLASAETVSVVSTGATKFNGVTVADTTAVAATTGSTLKTVTIQGGSTTANAIWGNAVTTVNLNDTGAVATVVNAAAGTRAVTVNTTGTAAIGGFTDAQATTLNINSNGTAAMALGTFTAAKATTVNYASSAIANTSLTLTAAAATTLNVSGTKVATMTMAGNTVLATVNVTGSAGLTTDFTAGATVVSLLDTTGTTGKSVVTLNTSTAVNGGAGADFITVANTQRAISLGLGNDQATVSVTALAAGGSIDGGGGIDELVLTNADAVTLSTVNTNQTAWKAAVTGFEVLNIGTQTGSTVSATGAGSTFTTVKMTSAAAAQVLSNVSSGQTVEMVFGAAGTSVTTNTLTGGADTLTVKLGGDLSAVGRSFGAFSLPGVETVNIVTADTNTTFAGTVALATLTDANATSIVVSGNNGLQLIHTGTALYNFDASGLTKGAVNFTAAVLTTDTVVKGSATGGDYLNFAAVTAKVNATETAGTNIVVGSATVANTVTGGTGADTIYGGAAADVINGGGGNDLIFADAITAAGEVQTITFTTNNATASATVTVGGVAVAISNTSTPTETSTSIVAAASSIMAANPTIASIALAGATTVITYKPFTGDVAATTVTTTSGAQTNANVETTKGIVPGATGTGTTHAAADTLTGGSGNDTFFMTAGGAITLASTITDLNLGTNVVGGQVDQINIDGATTSGATAVVVVALTAAQQTTVTAAASLGAAVDAVLALAGTVNNVAQFTYGTDTYLIHNGATANAAFTAGEDTLIKITGVVGTIDASDFTIV